MAACLHKEYIPTEIAADILSGLPVKSLARFRCVSKPWLNLISDSRFAYQHLKELENCDHSSKDCMHNESSLFFISDNSMLERSERKLFSIGGDVKEDSFKVAFEFDFPLIQGKSFEIKSACCHGMICLVIDNFTVVLCNPSIREYKIIPVPFRYLYRKGICGLGFDPSRNDYKVVSLAYKQVDIFSVKRNSWRKIGGRNFRYTLHSEGLPINGCLYWAAAKGIEKPDLILCLDLSDETFSEISLPGGNFDVLPDFSLFLYGGCLCVYRKYNQSLWVMKQTESRYGVSETWTKLMTLPWILKGDDPFSIFGMCCQLTPKCFTKKGKLLVSVDNRNFALYDPKRKSYEHICYHELGQINYHKAIAYNESLISPVNVHLMGDNVE